MYKNFFREPRELIIGIIFFSFFCVSGTAQAALTDNLAAYWKLDETSGTRADSVGSSNLTSNNSVTQAVGKLTNSAQFTSASSQYLSAADSSTLSVGDIDFTVGAWVYLDTKAASQTFAGHYYTAVGNERSWFIGYDLAVDRFRFAVSGDGTGATFLDVPANNLGSPSTGTWYYIVAWHDSVANTINIQVNNGTVNSVSWSGGVHDSTGPFTIGSLGNPSLYMNGRIDGVGLWKRTLTVGERSSLYNSGSGLDYNFSVAVPPVISSVAVGATTTTSATITWTTDIAADSQVEYGTTTSYGTTTTLDSSLVTSHSVSLTGLTSGNTYHYRVISSSSGAQTTSSDKTFTPMGTVTGITTGLISYWKLDETSGTRADSVGSNNLTSTNSVGQVVGKLSNAASFTAASSQYLSVADNAQLSVGDIDFSVSGWVYLNSKSADQTMAAQYNGTGNQRSWNVGYYSTSDRFRFGLSSDGTSGGFGEVTADAFGSPSTGTWYYIVAWHDSVANTINIQVNNGTVNSVSWTTGVYDSTGVFAIGAISNPLLYMDGRIDSVGLWKRVLSPSERTTLYNSGSGFEYPFTVPDGITITSPSSYQVIQRNGSNQANITITGTYSGTPTAIEASWNGGPYATIVANPTGGTFSGTLTNQSVGQGTLTVRFTNDTLLSASKSYVGIGDIFVIAGQSNASGRAVNSQTYSSGVTGLKAGLFGNDDVWRELVDPVDSFTNQVDSVSVEGVGVLTTGFGSIWPLVTTYFLADQNVPIAFIPTPKGGTSITQWQPNVSNHGDTATLYGSMYRRINAVGGSVKAVLFWQGEDDVVSGTSQATYTTKLTTFADTVFSDFGVKTIAGQVGPYGGQSATSINNVRLGQIDGWNAGGNILPGPSLYDVDITDPDFLVHFKTDTDMQTAANRWWSAISKNLYSGTDARGPRLSSATYNTAKTQVTLTFTDETLPLLPASGLSTSAFNVKDNGVAKTISSADKISSNQIRLTLSSAATGTITVSLGEGNTAEGLIVPTDSSTYHLPAEIFINTATTLADIPGAPTAVSATAGNAQATVSFTAPVSNGGSAITGYTVTSSPGSITATGSSSPITITGLTNGTSYTFTVTATNAAGTGSASSASASVTPATTPDAPTSLNATAGNTQVGLTWSAPASNGGSALTDYLIEYKASSSGTWLAFADGTSTVTSTTVTGLVNNTGYDFRVSSINALGTGSPSGTATVTPVSPVLLSSYHSSGHYGILQALIGQKDSSIVTPSTLYYFTRTLKHGLYGIDVKELQKYLNTHGYPVSLSGTGSLGYETNYFGVSTKKALIKFQKAHQLVPDGVAGKKTYVKMK